MAIQFDDPVKQQIWETVRALNDAWTKGNPNHLARFFHCDMIAIAATERNRLEGAVACVAAWKHFAETTRIQHWEEIDPVIRVYGDSAVVAYYYDIAFEMGGKSLKQGGRDMFFFIREGGKWWAVADQFSSYPVKGSEESV